MSENEILKRNDRIMKRIGLFALAIVAVVMIAAVEEKSGTTVKYRAGAVLSFDTSVQFKDEDANWSFGWKHMRRLANERSGTVSNGNFNLATNSFGVTYPSVPQVVVTSTTNCSVISKTTTNFVVWGPATNLVFDWYATAF